MKLFQKGWSFAQDGPGNRLVYHMQGCNLRCPWCSNPEGLPEDGALMVHAKYLVDSVCPYGAVRGGKIDRSNCVACQTRACVTKNKTQGIMLSCFAMTPAEMAAEAEGARHLFHSGGGVTFSGGEPLLQFAALKKTLALLKERGIHTAIETNALDRRLPDIFTPIDFLVIDLKHYDNKKHRATVGAGNAVILGNIKAAAARHPQVLVRITLVAGFNAAARDAECFARFFARFQRGNLAVELLKYHEYGWVKWEQCGLEYRMKHAEIDGPTEKMFRNRFAESGIKIIKT